MKKFYLFIFYSIIFLNINSKTTKDIEVDVSEKFSVESINGSTWRKVQKKAKDTVIQLYVENSEFNWLEPYKSPDQTRSSGSGFFIDSDGYLVSNFHVVDQAINVKIQIPSFGKRRLDAEVVGVNPDRDLSLLKLTDESVTKVKKKLGEIPFLKFGNSDKVLRTQEVMAMGYPLGQEKLKTTQGIVSGRERVWGESYIQITAPLNPGNSGGPCLNNKGEVIGINTAKYPKSENVGYIIPINDLKSVIKDLRKIKFLRKPILGCEFNYGNDEMVKFLKNPEPGGLYISRVYPKTLFEKVGVKEGDMLYEINGKKIDVYGETSVPWSEDKVSILDLLNRFIVDQDINVIIYRKGEKKEFNFKFELLDELPIRKFYPPYEKVDYEIIGGMVVMDLALNHVSALLETDPYLVGYKKRENRYDPYLLITHVFPDSQTREARTLGVSDIITHVNGEPTKTLEEFRKHVLKSKKDGFLTVKSKDQKFMVLSLEKILKEEDNLVSNFLFKPSKLIKELGGVMKKEIKPEKTKSDKTKKRKVTVVAA